MTKQDSQAKGVLFHITRTSYVSTKHATERRFRTLRQLLNWIEKQEHPVIIQRGSWPWYKEWSAEIYDDYRE